MSEHTNTNGTPRGNRHSDARQTGDREGPAVGSASNDEGVNIAPASGDTASGETLSVTEQISRMGGPAHSDEPLTSKHREGESLGMGKKIGLVGRLRIRVQRLKDTWLETSVPRDEDKPLEPGTVAHKLASTWPRKIITLGVALMIGIATAWIVVPGV